MDAAQLRELVHEHESQTLELKENLLKPGELADYVMQLANAQGGFIVLGLTHDRPPAFSRKVRDITQDHLDSISRAVRDCLRPPVDSVRVELVTDDESASQAVVIEVPDSPVLHQHINGAIARRRGGEREPIYLDREASHVAAKADVEYELRVVTASSAQDVDVGTVAAYRAAVLERNPAALIGRATDGDVLRGLRAIKVVEGVERLTVLGGVMFAARPDVLVPQSRLLFVQFPGKTVAQPGGGAIYIHSEEVTGSLPQVIERTERLLSERLSIGVLAEGFKVRELPAVPRFALREAIVNAVSHRDYALTGGTIQVRLFADRIEIQSPGGLPYPVTVENIVTESYARNPRIADVLRQLGYVERHGLGIDNMIRAMTEAHLPPPEFKDSATSFTVTLRLHAFLDEASHVWLEGLGAHVLPEDLQRILAIARDGRLVNSDVQALNFVDGPEATRQLQALVKGGYLTQHGTRGAAYYTLEGEIPRRDATRRYPPHVLDSLTSVQRTALDVVVSRGRAKASEVVDAAGMDRRHVQRALAGLVERQILLRHGASVSDPNAFYEANPDYEPPSPDQAKLF